MQKRGEIADRVTVLRMLSAPEKQLILQLARDLAGGAAQFVQRVQAILDEIDQDVLYRDEMARYTYGVWDHESPINGVPADVVRSRHNMGDNDGAYWIARDGQVFIFQPVKGERDEQKLEQMALRHVNELVEEAVRWQVADLVEQRLLG
jgi:hypothetical protein